MRFLLLCLMLLFPKAAQAYEPVPTPGLRLVLQARVTVDPAVEVRASDHGKRRFIAITGGTFTGDGIRGEVMAGGASAIYGSDAMLGVVNFKTIQPFDGVRADVQFGQDKRGDVFKKSASVTLGSAFADDKGRHQQRLCQIWRHLHRGPHAEPWLQQ